MNKMKETITGKIIRIIDKRTVIIDLGSNDRINTNSIFSIMGEPEEIFDPETNETLGEVTIVKSRVKAKEVAEKFTIATTKWKTARISLFDSMLGGLSKGVEAIETDEGELNVDESDIKPWRAISESPVKVGDIVKVEIEAKTEIGNDELSENTNIGANKANAADAKNRAAD